jgi:O-antigen ligase
MPATLPVNEAAPVAFAPIRPRPVTLSARMSRRRRAAALVACSLAVAAGLAAAVLSGSGHSAIVLAFPALLIPVAIWKWDEAGVIVVVAIATVVEQLNNGAVGPGVPGAFTQQIPLFHSITQGIGVNFFELLLVLILVTWVMKGALRGSLHVPHSALSRSIGVFLLVVMVGFGIGLSHGGSFRWAIWEIRPFVYLGAMFWLSASLLDTRRALRAVLWTLVLGSGFKALQGLKIYIPARHLTPRPDAILGHEEAFFFGLFIFLTLCLWIFEQRGALRTTATALLPAVLLANLANTRRTSWAILALGLVALIVVAYQTLPHRRPLLRRLGVVVLIGSALYFPAFWNNDSTVGQPAHAIHSQIKPNARDKSSDLYRTQETANLLYNIRQSPNLGKGFGVPIRYALRISNISSIDPMIAYVPHNGVLYIWMRLGIAGEAVFLMVIAAAIIRAVELARVGDQELALFGTLTVSAIVAYLVMGYNDMGFTWFRIALCMGVLFGVTEAALRLARREQPQRAGAIA